MTNLIYKAYDLTSFNLSTAAENLQAALQPSSNQRLLLMLCPT